LGGKTNFRLGLPWIEDYQVIKGLEVVDKFRSELEYLEFARHMEGVDKVYRDDGTFKVITKGGGELQSRSVILATGSHQKRLEVPGEKDFIMKGLCYSALSYAPLFIDRITIVVGDGDLALRSAAELATVARHVYLVCETGSSLNSPLGKKMVAAENVTVLEGSKVLAIKGDLFARAALVQDPSGKQRDYEADAIFVEMALVANTKMVAGLVDLDDLGRIIVDCNNRTNIPGLFAAGDVTNTFAEQVLVAVGEGAKAALSAYEYLLPNL
jgi:alkyl hydroperoxide reductase subunit AhpF